jgi:hypothetical protein
MDRTGAARRTLTLIPLMRFLPVLSIAIFGVLTTVLSLSSAAQDEATLERQIKAANVYKFAGYVEWPDSAFTSSTAPIVIGVLGDDAMLADLAQIVPGRTIDARPVQIRRIRPGETIAGLQVLFVGFGERGRLSEFRAVDTPPLLVVTESEGALEQGSVINFRIIGGRVRFEISLDNAERRGLKLSSRLLTVAHFVRMAQQ